MAVVSRRSQSDLLNQQSRRSRRRASAVTRPPARCHLSGSRDGRRAPSSTSGTSVVEEGVLTPVSKPPQRRCPDGGGFETVAERPPQPAGPSVEETTSSTSGRSVALARVVGAGVLVVLGARQVVTPVVRRGKQRSSDLVVDIGEVGVVGVEVLR